MRLFGATRASQSPIAWALALALSLPALSAAASPPLLRTGPDGAGMPPAHAIIFEVATDASLYGPLLSGEQGDLSEAERRQLQEMVDSFKARPAKAPALTEKTSATGYTYSTSADACAGCHMLEYLQWSEGQDSDLIAAELFTGGTQKAAMHRLAFLDETFHHHWAENGERDSCLRCHVPTTIYTADRSRGVYAPTSRSLLAPNLDEGVTCVSCHLDGGGNIRGEHAYAAGEADHVVLADEEILGSGYRACQSCHGDPFWGALSNTVKEWEEQAADSGLNCVDCHMVSTNDFTTESHAFPGAHSPTMLKGALSVDLPETLPNGEVFNATVCNNFAGHNLPTGDQFRAYTVRVKVTGTTGLAFDHTISVSPRFNAIVIQERVDYDRTDPIAFGECRTLPYASLRPGSYTVEYELGFWLLKPTYLEVIIPSLGSAQSDGEVFTPLDSRTYTLTVTGN